MMSLAEFAYQIINEERSGIDLFEKAMDCLHHRVNEQDLAILLQAEFLLLLKLDRGVLMAVIAEAVDWEKVAYWLRKSIEKSEP